MAGEKYRILKCIGQEKCFKIPAKTAPEKILFGHPQNFKPFGNPLRSKLLPSRIMQSLVRNSSLLVDLKKYPCGENPCRSTGSRETCQAVPLFFMQKQLIGFAWLGNLNVEPMTCTSSPQVSLCLHSSTVMVPESQTLLRPGRHGDVQPKCHGTHVTYKKWFKQLRRLEAFARGSEAHHNLSSSKVIHQTREWRSILKAPGFSNGFQVWWACRPHRYPGNPYDLPSSPLPAEQAILLCKAFENEVRALEEVLIKELQAKARASHEDNPNEVVKDMQNPQIPPVHHRCGHHCCHRG